MSRYYEVTNKNDKVIIRIDKDELLMDYNFDFDELIKAINDKLALRYKFLKGDLIDSINDRKRYGRDKDDTIVINSIRKELKRMKSIINMVKKVKNAYHNVHE